MASRERGVANSVIGGLLHSKFRYRTGMIFNIIWNTIDEIVT